MNKEQEAELERVKAYIAKTKPKYETLVKSPNAVSGSQFCGASYKGKIPPEAAIFVPLELEDSKEEEDEAED